MQTREALYIAQRQGLDLVEMQPNAEPPVCRIMDYGKYRYDEGMKKKDLCAHFGRTPGAIESRLQRLGKM